MKFCYVDESQQSDITVIASILIDAHRLHISRKKWKDLLIDELENPNELSEIKGKELYNGRGYWKRYDGERRKQLITRFIEWIADRKHKITFGAVSKSKLKDNMNEAEQLGLERLDSWDIAAMHLILGVQKNQQKEKKNKGKTIFVFDKVKGEGKLLDFVREPPEVTEHFYSKKPKESALDQIVDVPFFVDSLHVGFIHLADLFAYIICRFAIISEGIIAEKYEGELNQLKSWMGQKNDPFLPDSMRWPQKNDDFTKFLRSVAPESLLRMSDLRV